MDFSHGQWVQTANKSIYYIYKCEKYCMWCNSNCLLSYVVQYDMYVVPFDCHAPNSIVKLSFSITGMEGTAKLMDVATSPVSRSPMPLYPLIKRMNLDLKSLRPSVQNCRLAAEYRMLDGLLYV